MDSEAKTDQSAASRNKVISEHLETLAISNCKEKQETAYANKTPQQKSDRSSGKLNLDTKQSRVLEEKDDQWLKAHPWENEIPWRQERMERRLDMPQVDTLPDKWLKGKTIHLEMISLSLPKLIDKMKGARRSIANRTKLTLKKKKNI